MKLGFIGTGNMASAMMGGIIKNNIVPAQEIIGADLFARSREKVRATLGIHVTDSNLDVVKQAEIIVLSVKPQFYESVINEIKDELTENQLIITIAPGKTLEWLGEKFGKAVPAIGFAIVVDELMNALQRQKIEIEQERNTTLILYDFTREKDAIRLARDFRSKEKDTALLRREERRSLESYVEYGKKIMAGSILYVQANHQIQVINLVTDEQKIVKSRD